MSLSEKNPLDTGTKMKAFVWINGAVLLVGLTVLVLVLRCHYRNDAEKELARLQTREQELAEKARSLEELNGRIAELTPKAETAQNLKALQYRWDVKLEQLSKVLDKLPAWIISLKVSGDEISFICRVVGENWGTLGKNVVIVINEIKASEFAKGLQPIDSSQSSRWDEPGPAEIGTRSCQDIHFRYRIPLKCLEDRAEKIIDAICARDVPGLKIAAGADSEYYYHSPPGEGGGLGASGRSTLSWRVGDEFPVEKQCTPEEFIAKIMWTFDRASVSQMAYSELNPQPDVRTVVYTWLGRNDKGLIALLELQFKRTGNNWTVAGVYLSEDCIKVK